MVGTALIRAMRHKSYRITVLQQGIRLAVCYWFAIVDRVPLVITHFHLASLIQMTDAQRILAPSGLAAMTTKK